MNSYYDLQNEVSLDAAIKDLRGFWKVWSTCLMQSVRLPVPRGLIITRYEPSFVRNLHLFLKDIHAKAALIRHDRTNEAPPYPRGGFVVPEAGILQVAQELFSQRRIVALYEPFDRLHNGYNFNLLFNSINEVIIEIAGPGFDASNLQRGDITPHEILRVDLADAGEAERIRVLHVTTDDEYRESVRIRIEKFREFSSRPSSQDDAQLSNLLLDQTSSYQPVPRALVTATIKALVQSEFIKRFTEETGVGLPINVSASLVNGGNRQIFWDATAPSLKFQGLISVRPERHAMPI